MDLDRIRRETPGISSRLHLDNCGASLMPQPVIDAVKAHLDLESQVGGYVAQERVSDRVEAFYSRAAALFGGEATDYAFAPSAVDAWVRAFYSVPMAEGDIVVTAFNEYCSNFIAYLQQAERRGLQIKVIGTDRSGALDLGDLASSLEDDRVKLVSLSQVPSSSGQVNDVAAVGRLTRAAGVPFLLDACQSIGQMPVNVADIGCDMMSGTGRKFLRGPRGTGFLYVAPSMREKLDPVFLTNASASWTRTDGYDLRGDARLFEGWEKSIASLLGLSEAMSYYKALGVDACGTRTQQQGALLRSGLAAMDHVDMTCPPGSDAAIITFRLGTIEPDKLKAELESDGIAIQVARDIHTRLDLEARGYQSLVRVSPHYFTSDQEIDRFLDRIQAYST